MMFKKFLFSVFALCFFMSGATKAADISTIEANFKPDGAIFTYDFTINWATQKLVVVMDVSKCKGEYTDSHGNVSPENLFSVRGASETNVDYGMHVWFDKSGNKKFYIQDGWDGWNGVTDLNVTTVNDYKNVTLVFTKAAGISVNGTATNGTTTKTNYLDVLNSKNFFTNYSNNYKFESQQGNGRSHAIYKSVKVVPLSAESNAIAYNESGKTSATLLQSGVANATEKNTTVNLSNQIFRVVMNLDNCNKTDDNNYNLLNLSAGETGGAYQIGSTGNGVVHVYYQKKSRRHTDNVNHTTATFNNGVLWFDIINNSNNNNWGASPVEITGGDVTIELRSDGIYVNNERKILASGAAYSSLISNLFTAESHKVYYGNNENSANQASAAVYKEISIVPFGAATKLLQGANNNETLSSLVYAGNENIVIDRTFVSTDWNTLCLPFALTNAKLKAALGNDVKVCKFGAVTDNVISFVDCSSEDITAGEPYLVKPTTNVLNPGFIDVQVSTLLPSVKGENGKIQFAGTINPIALNTDGTHLFLAAEGKLKRPNANNTMKGFRAYLIVPAGTDPNKLSSRFGGVETAIAETFVDAVKTADNRVFNLQGQMVGTSLNGLPAGLYIQNGKKVLVRK